tara:strand:+ start:254 stop:433 length:180 start_codon:yes stop_codon:yes gene_type:complete
MKVGDLVKSRRYDEFAELAGVGIIVKDTPDYPTTQYHVLMGGRLRSFAARHLEVVNASR